MLTLLSDPSKVDFDEVKDTVRPIQVALVCIVCLSNVALIVSRFAKHGCKGMMLTARHTIQISLALAGIVSALYYNVISAIIIFDMDNHGLDCKTIYLASCYFFAVLPLVYTTGLVLLAFDLILRFKFDVYKTLGKSRVYSILCALLPWAVAFSVAGPLTLTDIQWHLKCANTQTNQHLQLAIICSTLIPAGLILLIAIGVAVSIRPKRYYDFQRGFDSPMYAIGNVTTSSTNTDHNINGIHGSIKQLNGTSSTGNTSSPSSSSSTSSPQSQSPTPITSSSDDNNAYPSYTQALGKSVSREKCQLLFSMLFFAVIVLPYGCLFMYLTTEYQRLYTTLLFYMVDIRPFVAYQALSSALNLYPIVLPIFWICAKY